jgi:hypothetical protein
MTKRDKSSVLIANNLGRHALVFNEDDVVLMLRAAVEHEGSQVAFAKRHGLDRVLVNMILNGKKSREWLHCKGSRAPQGVRRRTSRE